ncbi:MULTISPECIES: 50S ribosomal protein L30 [Persephonella]|uniref:Large ribosomal subunit protein uL30 n=1 Tax=Persephonella marina (strain DSM 14350 / EX-H1) TaxID=123214 RepID=RL30_PERMH|nr:MULTISPECIES: 50S ribosomal protein L30 [Persephonella]C0QQP1.1 RecName: Full=Large ribosomal subunit protein uL30; AltName: Full=50S ribosomal protein L30 [Persephonella marina EX-H1]ACO04852.1 ribosomal protein L30 [Persephonella marina EX-H1]
MRIKVKLVRGLAGKRKDQIKAVRSLGLKKVNDERILEKNPMVLGNINKVKHLIQVEEVE